MKGLLNSSRPVNRSTFRAARRLKPRFRLSETRVRRQRLRSHSSSHTTPMPTRSRRL
ncbi:hypothetical protein J6590_068843 [Homalodisca vitripennis]|nr:hypothetical protein J6590_068843 [Homalodisca vitripennis]